VSKGSPADESGSFFASHRYVIPLIVVAALIVLRLLWPRLKPKLLNKWHKAKQGAAIFSDWAATAAKSRCPRARRISAGSASTSSSWRDSASR
jgi:hypothetical protein